MHMAMLKMTDNAPNIAAAASEQGSIDPNLHMWVKSSLYSSVLHDGTSRFTTALGLAG